MEDEDDAVRAFAAGVDEADRRERGEFDGLLGQLPKDSSVLLRDIISRVRTELLELYSEDDARSLLIESHHRPGFHHMRPIAESNRRVTELVLDLLNMIHSAVGCVGTEFAMVVLGPAGARDRIVQDGKRKGGKKSAESRASDAAVWQEGCIQKARSLLKDGRAPRELAGILAKQYCKSPQQVNAVLKKAKVK